jgi:hypothetical protein
MSDADQYLTKAKQLAAKTYNDGEGEYVLDEGDVYVVWFSKTLGNWKALVSTDVVRGLYLEVTHNGAKQETYVDRYEKVENRVWPDGK